MEIAGVTWTCEKSRPRGVELLEARTTSVAKNLCLFPSSLRVRWRSARLSDGASRIPRSRLCATSITGHALRG